MGLTGNAGVFVGRGGWIRGRRCRSSRSSKGPGNPFVSQPRRIVSIAGARPNFMKIAPIVAALKRRPGAFESVLVHTGQHYDEKLSQVFFDELGIPRPDINLNVGSGSHAQQTAAIMAAFEPVLAEQRVDLVLVVGDVNSTIACALVASKLGVPSPTSRPAFAASTARCRRRSTGCSPTRSRTCCSPPRNRPPRTCAARAWTRRRCTSSAT